MVDRYLRERYVTLVTFGDDRETGVEILVDSGLPAASRDAETGWPCFK